MVLYMKGPIFGRAYIRNGLSVSEYGELIYTRGKGGLYSGGLIFCGLGIIIKVVGQLRMNL